MNKMRTRTTLDAAILTETYDCENKCICLCSISILWPKALQTRGVPLISLFNYLLTSPYGYRTCWHPPNALLLIIAVIQFCIPQEEKPITLCKPHPAVCLSLVNGSSQRAVRLKGPCLIFPQRSLQSCFFPPSFPHLDNIPQEKTWWELIGKIWIWISNVIKYEGKMQGNLLCFIFSILMSACPGVWKHFSSLSVLG